MKIPKFLPVLALVTLTACNSLPTYKPDPDEKMVPIRVLGAGQFSMCQSGVLYSLPLTKPTENTAYIQVPVGGKLGLSVYMSQDGYQHISYCNTGLSFFPKEGKAYVSNTGMRDQKCFIELVEQDDTKDTGVKVEPTVSNYTCRSLSKKISE